MIYCHIPRVDGMASFNQILEENSVCLLLKESRLFKRDRKGKKNKDREERERERERSKETATESWGWETGNYTNWGMGTKEKQALVLEKERPGREMKAVFTYFQGN